MHTPGFCAIIVAGGKSSRLGNTPKAGLSNGTHTLLDRALLAVSQADACVVVGPETLPVPNDVLLTREDPRIRSLAQAVQPGTNISYFGLNDELRSYFPSDDELRSGVGARSADLPDSDVTLTAFSGSSATFNLAGQSIKGQINLYGIYNIFNPAAAMATMSCQRPTSH